MVNENIITALHNAVQRGESLDQAISILINSGYNQQEVREASQFVGRGIIPLIEPKKDEQLLPTQNIIPVTTEPGSSLFKKLNFFKLPMLSSQKSTQSSLAQNQQQITQQLPVQKADSNEKPKKKYTFEIMLLVVLLFLMGILIATIMFKDAILSFLSG